MDNSTSRTQGPIESVPTSNLGPSPSTLEIILGILTLVLGLAAVTVTVAQFCQGRAAKETHRLPGQPDIELPDYSIRASDTNPVDLR
jgi:hypothetical protein